MPPATSGGARQIISYVYDSDGNVTSITTSATTSSATERVLLKGALNTATPRRRATSSAIWSVPMQIALAAAAGHVERDLVGADAERTHRHQPRHRLEHPRRDVGLAADPHHHRSITG